MERTTKKVKLPITGYEVELYTYYLRGDRIAIEKIMTDAVDMTAEGKLNKVDVGYRYKMEDEAVIRAIKSIKDGNKELEVSDETIHSLPESDYELLRENLPGQSEKKSTTRQSGNISKKVQKREG